MAILDSNDGDGHVTANASDREARWTPKGAGAWRLTHRLRHTGPQAAGFPAIANRG